MRYGRSITFQMVEVAVPRALFTNILGRIEQLRQDPIATPRREQCDNVAAKVAVTNTA